MGLFIGLFLGWLITNLLQGMAEGRRYLHYNGRVYKHIAGPISARCPHVLNPALADGISKIYDSRYCIYCTALWISLDDIKQVHYER